MASVNTSMAIRFTAQFLVSLFFLFTISVKLTAVMLVSTPLIVVAAFLYGRYIRSLSKQVQDALAKGGELAADTIACVRTVRSFGRERAEAALYARRVDEAFALQLKSTKAEAAFFGSVSFLANTYVVIIMSYGGSLVVSGELSTGQLTSFILYATTMTTSVGAIIGVYSSLMSTVGSSQRVFQLLARRPRVRFEGGRRMPTLTGDIRFRGVNFSYPSRRDVPVLRRFSLHVKPGSIVALVGMSGAGKSTIVRLVLGHYVADGGQVLIDDVNIKAIEPADLRKSIAIVSQVSCKYRRERVCVSFEWMRSSVSNEKCCSELRDLTRHELVRRRNPISSRRQLPRTLPLALITPRVSRSLPPRAPPMHTTSSKPFPRATTRRSAREASA